VAGPLGGIVGAPLSAWLVSAFSGVGGLAGWQWMLLIEGLPCVAMGILTYFTMSDRPEDARWLSADEKRLLADEIGAPSSHHAHSFAAVVKDVRIYVLAFAYFCIIASIYAMSFWLPTIIKTQGVASIMQLGWYVAIPYVASAICMYYFGRRSDKLGERRYHSAIPALIGALALAASILTDGHLGASLALLTVSTAMMWIAYTVFWAIPSQYVKGTAAAGGIALINTIGLSGGFWGPALVGWAKTAAGNLHLALLIISGLLLVASCVLIKIRPPSSAARTAELDIGAKRSA